MFNQVDSLHKELAGLVHRHTDRDGPQSTEIPSLHFSRYSAPHHFTGTGVPYRINKPSIYFVVQGMKNVIFGEERFQYGPPHYLVASMDLPIIAEVLEASVDVAEIALRVGYESVTQFTREYSRMFGLPPRKDIQRLKGYNEHRVDHEGV
ncbi:hypothetical protein D3C75_789160 [compost metagenome]